MDGGKLNDGAREMDRTSAQVDSELQRDDEGLNLIKTRPDLCHDSEGEWEKKDEEEEEGTVWIDEDSPPIAVAHSSGDEAEQGGPSGEELDVSQVYQPSFRDYAHNRGKLLDADEFIDTISNDMLESPDMIESPEKDIEEIKSANTDLDQPVKTGNDLPRNAEKVVITSHGIKIRMYVADISRADADAVVTSDNPHCNDKSLVTRALCAVPGGQEFREKRRRRRHTQGPLELGRVYSVAVKNKEFPFKYVLQAIITGYDSRVSSKKWRRLLYTLYKNVYRKADEKDVRSVAVPLLGTGRGEGSTDTSVEAAARTVSAYNPVSLEEVHFVTLDRELSDYLAAVCESCCDPSNEPGLANEEEDDEEEEEDDPGTSGALFAQQLNQLLAGVLEHKPIARTQDAPGYSPGTEQDLLNNHTEFVDEEQLFAGLTINNSSRDTGDEEQEKIDRPFFETVIDEDLMQTGNQPPGTMSLATLTDTHLPGYEAVGTLVITYQIPSGNQTDEHPHPGTRYHGVHRTAFLPDNEQGRMVTRMLKEAFERRLVFTVGRSQTTGEGDVVRWGPISHKTSQTGGHDRYGYPDSDYLDTVTSELLNLGITDPALGAEES